MIITTHKSIKQLGEVSLFVVIFATLLMTIVTVSFVRIMMHDQQQASTIDLSQSAYDSAQAGVEDAKRAILYYKTVCGDPAEVVSCGQITSLINSGSCNAFAEDGGLADLSGANDTKEVKVQGSSGDKGLNQAYTCVKITLNTPEYLGVLEADDYEIIPLVGTGDFDTVDVSWFTSQDYSSGLGNPDLLSSPLTPLFMRADWPDDRPPVLRAQLIQHGSEFSLGTDFDNGNSVDGSNINTLFLYPSSAGSVTTTLSFVEGDIRMTPTGKPHSVKCRDDITLGGYACTARLTLPKPIKSDPSDPLQRVAYLRIGAVYGGTHYSVSLSNGPASLDFDGVQPVIDSTGRANNLFRRVQARVRLSSDFSYPKSEIQTNGNLCKNFFVTDDSNAYSPGGCNP